MRRVWIGVALLLGITSILGSGFILYWGVIRPAFLFSEERSAIERLLKQWWEGRPPPGVGARQWEAASQIAYNGLANACFTHQQVSLEEMQRLKTDVQEKMKRPATMESLRWFWDRLGEISPFAKKYITQMRPLLEEMLKEEPAEPARAAPPG